MGTPAGVKQAYAALRNIPTSSEVSAESVATCPSVLLTSNPALASTSTDLQNVSITPREPRAMVH